MELTADQVDHVVAEDAAPIPDPDLHRPICRGAALHLQRDPGEDAEVREVSQRRTVRVADPLDQEAIARGAARQRRLSVLLVLDHRARNGVTVRVTFGKPESGIDQVLHPLAEVVLEHLGFLVDLVPADSEHPVQEGLQQPVPPYDAARVRLAVLGQGDLPPARLLHQTAVAQPVGHRGDRGRGHPQPSGDARRAPRLALGRDGEDDLEIVLDRLGQLDPAATASRLLVCRFRRSYGDIRVIKSLVVSQFETSRVMPRSVPATA